MPCRHAGTFGGPFPAPHYPPSLLLEPIHVGIGLCLHLEAAAATCTITTTVRANQAGARELVLNGVSFNDLRVSGTAGHELVHRYDGERIFIVWATPFNAGEERAVVTAYRVCRPVNGMLFYRHTRADVNIAASSDHETERARYWLACVDHPSSRPRMDWAIETDAAHTAVANGDYVDETITGERKTTRWRLEHPCPSYLACFVAGDLISVDAGVADGGAGPVPIKLFAPKGLLTEADLLCSYGKTKDNIEWITRMLGTPLPWRKYYQFVFPGGLGGAMENISLIAWDPRFAVDARLRPERGWYVDSINLHELAHTYFGNTVVSRDYSHNWLKEGWASYMQWAYTEAVEDAPFFEWFVYHQLQSYLGECKTYRRAIVNNTYQVSFQLYDEHLYPGGAWRLRMLNQRLGDAFWPAVRTYLKAFAGDVVETTDFRRVLEKASGQSLVLFFEQWLYKPGCPVLKVTHVHDAATEHLTVTVEQTQVDPAAGVGLFDASVEVHVEVADGQWIQGDVILTSLRSISSITFKAAAAPLQIVIDPHFKLCHAQTFAAGDDILRRTVTHGPSQYARMNAVVSLAASGTHSNLEFLGTQLPTLHWGVREVVYTNLAPHGGPTTAGILVRALQTEDEPRALMSLLDALAKHQYPFVAAALRALLSSDKAAQLPQTVVGAALTALGCQRDPADLDLLTGQAAVPFQVYPWLQAGALVGLGHLHTPAAHAWLLANLDTFEHPKLRLTACASLGTAASWLPSDDREPARAALAHVCCADEDAAVSLEAADALAAIGAGQHTDALRSVRPRLSNFHLARADAIILRGTAQPGAAAEVSRLQHVVETLTARIDKLEAALAEKN
eukprot:m.246165 g.246165  ORF g.246165 m.246165 type:complete len:847 (-) comp14931_c0_seq1:89-2629(-)